MNAYEKVRTARSSDRPTALAYINNIFSSFIEFHGDRRAKDDGAIVSGIASLNGMPVTVIAIEKGSKRVERLQSVRCVTSDLQAQRGIEKP